MDFFTIIPAPISTPLFVRFESLGVCVECLTHTHTRAPVCVCVTHTCVLL
jgi:hypothetical protein